MADQSIQIRIPFANAKLQSMFPLDPRGDLKLLFRTKEFKLQKAYLRLQSGYFKKKCSADLTILQIQQKFNIQSQFQQQQIFSNIMSCFYGAIIEVPRIQVLKYYPIVKFLQVQILLTQLRKDMVDSVQHYDLFVLMKTAHKYDQQQIFETCLLQLEKQQFEQLKYGTSDLLNCSSQLFKLIIRTHNRSKSQGKKGITYKDIDQLIRNYCQHNNLGQDIYHQYKFQLIDKTKLTSQQYKEIFINQLTKPRQSKMSFMRTDLTFKPQGQSQMFPDRPMYQSMIGTIQKKVSNQLTLQMQYTFQKKLNQQLIQQKNNLIQQLKKLKQSITINNQSNISLQRQIQNLKQIINIKDKQQKQQKNTIIKFQKIMEKMQIALIQKDKSIKKLQQKVQKLCTMTYQQQKDMFVQSQMLPSYVLGDIMKKKPITGQVSSPKSSLDTQILQSMDQDDIQEKYQARLQFDINPISINKIYIPTLVEFLGTQGFSKKKLSLIYRRSDKHPNVGDTLSIRERKPLVLLIRTGKGIMIGGYISISIPKYASQYLQDPNACIFSISKSKIFKVQPGNRGQAIYLSDHYLIAFGNDLMISKDCLNEQSYCQWSSSYQRNGIQNGGPQWLAGGSEFMIKDLQFYQIQEAEMQMTL